MDFPAQYPDSPAKPLSGPARARLAARQNRTSSLKPYSRRTSAAAPTQNGLAPSSSASDLAVVQPQTPGRALAVPAAHEAKSPFSSLRAASPLALLGSVGKGILSRPLSWLASSSTAAKSDTEGTPLPKSASSHSLGAAARTRAALDAGARTQRDDPEREAPSLAARAIGARLAAGVLGSPQQHAQPHDDDLESQSVARYAPTQPEQPALRRSTRTAARSAALSPPPQAASSQSSRIGHSEGRDAVASPMTRSRTSKRVLDLGRTDGDDGRMELLKSRSPSPAASTMSARAKQRLSAGPSPLVASGSHAGPYATVGYRRGSSLRPDDSLDARMTPSQSSPSFAFGYGNERRLARSSFGLPPTASPFQLATRSPLAPREGRSSLGPLLGSELGTSPHHLRGGSIGPGSVATTGYRASSPAMRGTTPKRRDWASLGLAASRSPGPGDDMMREYIATRTLPGTAPRSLGMNVFSDPRSSRASSVAREDDSMSLTPSRLGKRDIDMSVDGDETGSTMATARKRQMVWHPQLGFISQEELRAREPKPPSPKNEAERLLSVLESMKGAARSDRGAGAPTALSRMLQPISVPAPVSDRSLASTSGKASDRSRPIGVAPYSRALRRSKLAQSQQTTDERLSLRAKLRRSRPALEDSRADSDLEDDRAEDHDMDETETETEVETEEEPVPPKRQAKQPVRRSRRLRARDVETSSEDEEMAAEEVEVVKPKSKAKVQPKSTQAAAAAAPVSAARATNASKQQEENKARSDVAVSAAPAAPKPASHRISLAAAKSSTSAPPPKKDNFTVRSQADSDGTREKSSLRQGAAKKFRTHQSSGRISAWEEDLDEDDGLPGAEDLSKIKMPTNLFPTNFSFGNGSSTQPPSAAASTGKKEVDAAKPQPATSAAPSFSFGAPASKEAPSVVAKPKPAAAEPSLLGRLGSFASPGSEDAKQASTTPAAQPPASSFSFAASAPAQERPKPAFSFQPPKPDEAKATAAAAASKPAPAAPDFFSTPVAPAQPAEKTDESKKSGPVPNFFGNALAKVEAKPAAAEPAKSASSGFSFGKPASTPTFSGFGQPAPAPTDDGKKDATADKPATTAFSFGAAPATKTEESKPPPAASTFAFGQSQPSSSPAAGPFSFGAPAASAPEKRAAEGEQGGQGDAKPSAKTAPTPGFSFGGAAGFGKPAASPAPAPAEDKKAEEPAKKSFFFGSTDTSATPAEPTKPSEAKAGSSFSFSPAASSPSTPAFGFGSAAAAASDGKPASSPTTETPKPAFTFGAPATSTPAASTAPAAPSTPGGFTFGASAPTSTAATTPKPSTPAASTFGGGFGTPAQAQFGNSEMMEDSPTTGAAAATSAAPATQSNRFTFGAPSPAATGAANGSASPFGISAAGGSSVTSPNLATSKPPSFSFGASAAVPSAPLTTPSTPTFGAAPLAAGTTGMFGSSAPAPSAVPASAAPSPGFTFTAAPPTSAAAPSVNVFGSASAAPTPFGSAPSSPAPFIFGASQPQQPQQPQQVQPPSTAFTFGSTNAASPAPSFSFGSNMNTPSQQQQPGGGGGGGGGAFTFGGQPGGAATPAPAPFTFGAPQSQPPTPGAGGPFAFNAAPSPGPPSFGAPQQQQQQQGATATPPGSAGGLFNIGAASASQGPGGRPIKPRPRRRP
ncbi:uncharacterized protein PFL1_05136 [Pseudozyma flocculosa PF-1]|nr:uncharacterized protein PFL1_05136 [Pseudozyma flocculosa PF-1]EPQ27213.1 hypothetical protein PFL1_05136 [Pseudozyma flocculosa PF-1]